MEAPNGKESILYENALKFTGDSEKALETMATAYTPGFKGWYGDWESQKTYNVYDLDANGEPKIDDVLKYLQRKNCVVGEMLKEDVSDFNTLLGDSGVSPDEASSALFSALSKGNRSYVDIKSLRSSGLYTEAEIARLESEPGAMEQLTSAINKLPDEMTPKARHFMSSESPAYPIYDGTYNQFGKENRLTDGEVDIAFRENVVGINDPTEFGMVVNSSMRQEIADEYENNSSFREDSFDYYSTLTPANSFNPGTGISGSEKLHELANFAYFNPSAFQSLRDVSMEVLSGNLSDGDFHDRMKRIESIATEFGIDIIGLKNLPRGKAEDVVSSLYLYAQQLARGASADHHAWFESQLSSLPGRKPRAVRLPSRIEGMNAVVSNTNLSDSEMFERYYMLRVEPNTYISVDREASVDELYSSLAEVSRSAPSLAGIDLSGMSEEESVSALKRYVSSVSDSNNTPEMVMIRMALGLSPTAPNPEVDIDYELSKYIDGAPSLDGGEQRRLHNYYLKSKIEGGESWKRLFQYVGFDETGNPYMKTDDREALSGAELWAEGLAGDLLRDLSYGSHDPVLSNMFYHESRPAYRGEDFYLELYRKYPYLLSEYSGPVFDFPDGSISVEGSYDPFIRIGNRIYQKIGEFTGGSVYRNFQGSASEAKQESTQQLKPTYENPTRTPERSRDLLSVPKNEQDRLDKYLEC